MEVLVCRHCGRRISKPVAIDHAVRKGAQSRLPGSESAVQAGQATTVNFKFTLIKAAGESETLEGERVWMNLKDVIDATELDLSRASGCCGPNGEVNRRCKCGELVGREYGDCLLPATFFSPEANMTTWVPYQSDPVQFQNEEYNRMIEASKRRKHKR